MEDEILNKLLWVFFSNTGLLVAVGTYAIIDNWKSGDGLRLENLFDVIFNLGFLMVIVGGVVFIVSGTLVIYAFTTVK